MRGAKLQSKRRARRPGKNRSSASLVQAETNEQDATAWCKQEPNDDEQEPMSNVCKKEPAEQPLSTVSIRDAVIISFVLV